MKPHRSVALSLAASLLAFSACSKPENAHDHEHASAASATAAPNTHAHHAPHGGTLVELGRHQFNLEFVHDASAGTLTAWVLDAHAENFIRSPLAAIDLVVDRDGAPTPLTLTAVANSATGETVGHTSEFSAQAEWLKSSAPLRLTIPVLMLRDATFSNITATLPATRP